MAWTVTAVTIVGSYIHSQPWEKYTSPELTVAILYICEANSAQVKGWDLLSKKSRVHNSITSIITHQNLVCNFLCEKSVSNYLLPLLWEDCDVNELEKNSQLPRQADSSFYSVPRQHCSYDSRWVCTVNIIIIYLFIRDDNFCFDHFQFKPMRLSKPTIKEGTTHKSSKGAPMR